MDLTVGDLSNFSGAALPHPLSVPVMTREAFAAAIGLPLTVLAAQCDRGYWPTLKIGKYSFINVELVRKSALAKEFVA
ncbi:hypothetical protein K6V18_06600 [Ralstonia insidiosa]|uniref:hypothetical protein n=1 Tax=Ralstonia TaxID=48736 RepID=UPI00076EB2CD|nr:MULTISPECIES: hypothetical protein [Ralstonia]MBY4704672.1 hypothetical protein [Ralstonia insidiosa]GAQ30430.1 hypothetical protein SAMD00023378_4113 [Ralstonia sp. NT80]